MAKIAADLSEESEAALEDQVSRVEQGLGQAGVVHLPGQALVPPAFAPDAGEMLPEGGHGGEGGQEGHHGGQQHPPRLDRRIKSALLYPAVMLMLMLVVIAVLLVKVLPIFNDVYASLGGRLTGVAGGLLAMGQWLFIQTQTPIGTGPRAVRPVIMNGLAESRKPIVKQNSPFVKSFFPFF